MDGPRLAAGLPLFSDTEPLSYEVLERVRRNHQQCSVLQISQISAAYFALDLSAALNSARLFRRILRGYTPSKGAASEDDLIHWAGAQCPANKVW